jgi:hypothetical protein
MYIPKATLASTITNVDDGGADIRITAPAHGLTTGDTCFISGVEGTTEANGTFVVTRISDSQFTLDSTTFANTWTGGGGVYTGYRLQLSLGASDYDCHVAISYQRVLSGSVADLQLYTAVISSATNVLLTADPTYDFAIVMLNIFSTEASGDILATIQLLDKDQTAYKVAYVDLDAGYRFTYSNSGQSYLMDASGGMFFSSPPP